jgi:chromate transporter
MLLRLWQLCIAFLRVGVLGFGGGPSFIPLVQIEAVQNFHWMSNDEFADALAMGNALPGPIATKMSGFIGYKVAGWIGAIISCAALILPSLIAMIVMLTLLSQYKNLPAVQGIVRAIKPVVIILLLQVILGLWGSAFASGISAYVLAGLALIALQFLKISPVYVVLVTLVYGALQGSFSQVITGFFRH